MTARDPAANARTAVAAAEAELGRARGLVSPPVTEAKQGLALQRLIAARAQLDAAIAWLAEADPEAPFTRPPFTQPPVPLEGQGSGDGGLAPPASAEAAPVLPSRILAFRRAR